MQPWAVLLGVTALAIGIIIIAAIVTGRWRTSDRAGDSPLAFGITLEVVGIVFGTDRLIGYSLIGAGVILSLFSLYRRRATH